MRLILQRVSRASVTWDGGREAIGPGLLVLVGVGPEDDERTAVQMAGKIAGVRVFADARGRMDRSLVEVGGEALVVSQFTLYADLSRGRRPSFIGAAEPVLAKALYLRIAEALADHGVRVATGSFGAHMEVELVNDGPVTLVVSSDGSAGGAPGTPAAEH